MATKQDSIDKASLMLGPATNAIISKEEMQRFVDLGLGRGLDTTDPDLWRNKCSFIVRHATFKNVLGTDEGNLAEDYRQTVLSGNDLQEEFKESVTKSATTPIPIVLEAGASRSAVATRIVKGKRIVTRMLFLNGSRSTMIWKKVAKSLFFILELRTMSLRLRWEHQSIPFSRKKNMHKKFRKRSRKVFSNGSSRELKMLLQS